MRTAKLLAAIVSAVLLLEPCAFAEKKQQPQADVHQLANRVRKVIKLVEDAPALTCEMRNHLVKRLRSLDDALEAGNRSSARALVMAWTSEARSYQRAGLLSAAHGAVLHNGLQGFIDEIGEGWPKKPGPTRKWDPLPACDAGETSVPVTGLAASPLAVTSGGTCPVLPPVGSWDSEDTLILLESFLASVPELGPMLSGMLGILWPSNESENVSAIIDRTLECVIQQNAANALSGLRAGLSPNDGYFWHKEAWQKDCGLIGVPSDQWATIIAASSETCKEATQNIYGAWDDMRGTFVNSRILLQTSDRDNQLKLLPVFAQYETLYMTFLREGILMQPVWLASGRVGEEDATTPTHIMADELNPTFVSFDSPFWDPDTGEREPDRGIAYANSVYDRGLDAQPQPTGDNKWGKWITRNRYVRDMTLKVLDFRDTWKFMDPAAYPKGVEGGVKLTRMIYSDPIGHKKDDDFASFQPPANVAGPLKELTVWSQRDPTNNGHLQWGSMFAISALQSTNPPTVGPARSGEITGDATHDGATMTEYLDLRVSGPISEVKTWKDARDEIWDNPYLPSAINFKLAATGRWIHTGGGGYPVPTVDDPNAPLTIIPWKYPGHVLAAVKAMGIYTDFGKDTQTTDSAILGFRFYDSFFPSGALVSVASGWCMNVALTAGAQTGVYPCFSGPGQIWTYNTNTKAVTIGDGQYCLKATGTSSGSTVVIDACTGANDERWGLVPSATGLNGMIKSVESGLVLTATVVNNAIVTLLRPASGTYGSVYQQWGVTAPLTGEVHAIGSGRCLDVSNNGTAEGTPVQIYDCNGTAAQAWTYNESTGTLSVHNGQDCLGVTGYTIGATLQIAKCAGVSGHHSWIFDRDRTIIHGPTGYVLDVQSGGMRNGALAVLASPVAGKTSQQWSRPSRQGGNVHAMYAGKCLDGGNLDTNGTQAQISDCLASPAPGQEWTYHPLTHRITAHGFGTEHCLSISGTAVVVTDCRDDQNQLWTLQDNGIGGTIFSTASINTGSPMCMTLPGTGTVTASGTKVEVQACASEPANPNQQWIWP